MTDSITVLRCASSLRLAKLVKADGSIVPYDSTKTFDMAEVTVADLNAVAGVLRYLIPRRDLCVVRGAVADKDRTQRVRRLVYDDKTTGYTATLKEAAHHWIALDVEGVHRPEDIPPTDLIGCASYAVKLLPGEFHGVRALVQASAGHGLKPGSRLRIWYWASRPVTGAELTFWMRRSPVDPCLFRPAQINYTAAPLFETGVDHIPERLATLDGAEVVWVPAAEDLKPPAAPLRSTEHWGLRNQTSAERIIARSLFKVATAAMGEKHYQLRNAARTIGGLLDQSGISSSEASRVLMDAVRRAGGSDIDESNAARTIEWGLAVGRQAPLRLEDRRGV